MFIAISFWVIYVCLKSVMSANAVAVSFAGGILGHIVLGLTYFVFKLTGSGAVMYAMDVGCVLVPFLIAGVGSKLVGPQAPRQAGTEAELGRASF